MSDKPPMDIPLLTHEEWVRLLRHNTNRFNTTPSSELYNDLSLMKYVISLEERIKKLEEMVHGSENMEE